MKTLFLLWLVWFVAHFVAVLFWPIIYRFLKFIFLEYGKKGFTTLFYNLASTAIWLALAIFILNLANSNPEIAASLGIKAGDAIIDWKWGIPLLIYGFVSNAVANKWNKE